MIFLSSPDDRDVKDQEQTCGSWRKSLSESFSSSSQLNWQTHSRSQTRWLRRNTKEKLYRFDDNSWTVTTGRSPAVRQAAIVLPTSSSCSRPLNCIRPNPHASNLTARRFAITQQQSPGVIDVTTEQINPNTFGSVIPLKLGLLLFWGHEVPNDLDHCPSVLTQLT
jgi:hypothetical protein